MDYPSAGSGTTGNDSLVYAQWEAIHNPAIIGKEFQSDEDGGYRQGYYAARHGSFSDVCYGGDGIDEDFITYYAPSGLPFSLPKSVCQEKHSGMLYLAGSDEFIKVPEKCLTSFRLDDVVYEAFALEHEFIGYIPFPTGNVDAPLLDEHTIQNLRTIELYDLTDSYIHRSHVYYKKLEGFEGEYFAQGPIVEENGDVLRCLKCQMPIEECYCGRACICFAHNNHPLEECDLNRYLKIVGIPFFENNHLVKIEKYKRYDYNAGDMKKSYLLHDQMLDYQGRKLFLAKIGYSEYELTFEDVVSSTGSLIDVLELTIEDVNSLNIISNFKTAFNAYGLYTSMSRFDEAVDDEDFATAFYEGIKLIPAIGKIAGGVESVLSFVYSESVMNSLYVSAKEELLFLGNFTTPYCNKRRTELENIMNISKEQLYRIDTERLDNLHQTICTCH